MDELLPILSYGGAAERGLPVRQQPVRSQAGAQEQTSSGSPGRLAAKPVKNEAKARADASTALVPGIEDKRRAAAYRSMERLLEVGADSEAQLLDLVKPFTSEEYLEVAEERALAHQCGSPLCSNSLIQPKIRQCLNVAAYRGVVTPLVVIFCSSECELEVRRLAGRLGNAELAISRFLSTVTAQLPQLSHGSKASALQQQPPQQSPAGRPPLPGKAKREEYAAGGRATPIMLMNVQERDADVEDGAFHSAGEAADAGAIKRFRPKHGARAKPAARKRVSWASEAGDLVAPSDMVAESPAAQVELEQQEAPAPQTESRPMLVFQVEDAASTLEASAVDLQSQACSLARKLVCYRHAAMSWAHALQFGRLSFASSADLEVPPQELMRLVEQSHAERPAAGVGADVAAWWHYASQQRQETSAGMFTGVEDEEDPGSDISGHSEPLPPNVEDAYELNSEEEGAWLPDAILNFGRSVSTFGSLHLLLEAWATDNARKFLAGKGGSTAVQPLDSVAQEVLKATQGRLGRELPRVMQLVGAVQLCTSIERPLSHLLRLLSCTGQALPHLQEAQWQLVLLVLLKALSIEVVPELRPVLEGEAGAPRLAKATFDLGSSTEELYALLDLLLPSP